MKKVFLSLSLICALTANILSAESLPKPPENRFLFIVETSLSMNRSAKAAQETLSALIESGVHGQMNPGDTFGLWTFNEQLNAQFPMQRWIPGDNEKLTAITADFLKKRRFEKKGQLGVILPPLDSVVKASRAITVILISTGNEPIQGTPFDKEINAIYPNYARELRDAKLAFVTILVGREGKLVAYSVNSSLGPIQIPFPPIEPAKIAEPPKTNSVAAVNKAPVRATNQVAPIKKPPPNIVITKPQTNQPIAKVEVKTEPETIETTPVQTNVPAVVLEKPELPKATISNGPPPEEPIRKPIIEETASVNSTLPDSKPNLIAPQISRDDPSTFKPEPQSVGVSKDLPKPSFRSAQNKLTEHNQPPADLDSSTQETVVENSILPAPLVATQPVFDQKKFLLIGGALLLMAGILIFFLMRSSRSRSQPSLISRSIDRNK